MSYTICHELVSDFIVSFFIASSITMFVIIHLSRNFLNIFCCFHIQSDMFENKVFFIQGREHSNWLKLHEKNASMCSCTTYIRNSLWLFKQQSLFTSKMDLSGSDIIINELYSVKYMFTLWSSGNYIEILSCKNYTKMYSSGIQNKSEDSNEAKSIFPILLLCTEAARQIT